MMPALPGGAFQFVHVTTFFFSHSSYLDHDTGPGHPERPDRIRAITAALEGERFSALIRADAPGIHRPAILRVHPAHYVDAIEAATPARGRVHLDPDTVMSAQSFDAIGHCAGAATAAVDEVMYGGAKNTFVALRPPGHHAGIASPMG
ncbi:MAG: histone deacetylase family protein, partial [Candidatus Binatia bacterium]